MPGARPLRHRSVGMGRLHAHECDHVVPVEHGEESGHTQIVRDGCEGGKCCRLQVVGDGAGEGGHPRTELDRSRLVANDQAVVFESAEDAVGDRPVHAESGRELCDRQRPVGFGEDLEHPDAPGQRLGVRLVLCIHATQPSVLYKNWPF